MLDHKKSKCQLVKEIKELRRTVSELNTLENAHKKALIEFHEIERQQTTLMGNIRGMVFRIRLDKEWTIDFASEGCFELTGYTPLEIYRNHNSLRNWIPNEDLPILLEKQAESIREKKHLIAEYRIKTRNKKSKWVWEQSIPIFAENGAVIAVEGFVTDITDDINYRNALKKSELELRNLSAQLLTAQENERKRIAQELHDDIGQTISAITFGVAAASGYLERNVIEEGKKTLGNILPMIQSLAEEVDRICNDLRPSVLDNVGIIAAIAWFCRNLQSILLRIKIKQEIYIDENDVPEILKIVIYRVIQEAVNNAVKHSRGDVIHIYLSKKDSRLKLSVRDNGIGLNPQRPFGPPNLAKGIGISSMKERVELSGGEFSIFPAKNSGTIVQASWVRV